MFWSSVSAGIVEQHGGSIGVESTGISGSGSVFFFELNAKERLACEIELYPRTSSERTNLKTSSDMELFDAPIISRRRVLLVDDSALNRKMMLNVISKFTTDVVQVFNMSTI